MALSVDSWWLIPCWCIGSLLCSLLWSHWKGWKTTPATSSCFQQWSHWKGWKTTPATSSCFQQWSHWKGWKTTQATSSCFQQWSHWKGWKTTQATSSCFQQWSHWKGWKTTQATSSCFQQWSHWKGWKTTQATSSCFQQQSSAVQQFSQTKDNQHFLQYDRDIYYIGPFTKEAGVTWSALTKENLPTCVSLTNGLVSELAYFAAKQGFKNDVLFKWISELSGWALSCMGSASLDTTVSKTKLQTQAVRRRQSKLGGHRELHPWRFELKNFPRWFPCGQPYRLWQIPNLDF